MAATPKIVLEGKFTASAFAGLLKKLEGNRSAAYVLVSDGLSEKCLYFSVGAIRLSSMGRRRARTLEQLLTTHPKIDPAAIERARQRGKELGEPLEEALANMDYVDVIRECSTAIVRDEVLDLLVWDGAFYEYCEANPPPKIFDPRLEAVKLSFGVAKLIKEAEEGVARITKASAKFGAGRARLAKGAQAAYGLPGAVDAKVGEAILAAFGDSPSGTAFVDDIFLACRRRGFDVIQTAAALEVLVDARVLEQPKSQSVRISPEEEIERARKEAAEIEAALDLLINELVARQRLAQKYQAIGDERRAILNLKKVGEELALRNRAEEAIETFRQVLKVVPTDFPARERIVQLYERMKKIPEAIGEGLELARAYGKFGLVNRAKNVFRHLVALNPMQVDIRRELIELLVRMKDNQEAVAEYEQMAEIFRQQQDEQQLLAVYQQILKLDPNHAAAMARTRSIARRSAAFILPYAGLAAGFLILAAAVLYVAAAYRSVRDYNEARRLAFERADREDFAGARAAVDEFVKRHERSRDRVAQLRADIDEFERERRRARAEDEYGRARELEAAKRVGEAVPIYRSLLVTGKGTEWEGKAQERLQALEKEIGEAERLAIAVQRLYHDKKDREAFERARELIRRYGWTQVAQNCDVPLEIVTVPPGATISVNGKERSARTPAVVPFRLGLPYTLQLSAPGYSPEVRSIDLREELPYPYRVELKKSLRWRVPTLGPIETAPAVTEAGVFVGARDQRVYAVSPEGKTRWARSLGVFADVRGRTLRVSTRVLAADRTGKVTCFDAGSGEVLWRQKLAEGPLSGVAAAPGLAIVADERGALLGIEVDKGRQRWKLDLPGELAAPVATAEGDSLVLAVTRDALFVAADPVTGREVARFSTGGLAVAPPAATGTGFLVATEDGLLRFFARDGREAWRSKLPGPATAAPLGAGNLVFVPASEELLALELASGGEKWRQKFRAPIRATPAFRSGRLYVGATDGALYALTAETGYLRWVYRTAGEILAQPLAVADTVYVASTDFAVYAIAE